MKSRLAILTIILVLLTAVMSCLESGHKDKTSTPVPDAGSDEFDDAVAPGAPESGYRFAQYNFTGPEGYKPFNLASDGSVKQVYINARGGRAICLLNYINSDTSVDTSSDAKYISRIHVFSPEQNDPLTTIELKPADYPVPEEYQTVFGSSQSYIRHIDLNRNGTGIVALYKGKILYFPADSTKPAWSYDLYDILSYRSVVNSDSAEDSIAFSRDSNHIIASFSILKQDSDEPWIYTNVIKTLVFEKKGETFDLMNDIETETADPVLSVLSASADAKSLAIATIDDREKSDDDSTHSHLYHYVDGKLKWDKWLRNEFDATYWAWGTYLGTPMLSLTSDGSTLFAGGPGGKILKIDTGSGVTAWTYDAMYMGVIAVNPQPILPAITMMNVSDDGKRLVYHGEYVVFFDDTTTDTPEPKWRSGGTLYQDYSKKPVFYNETLPSPNGFAQTYEDDFVGAYTSSVTYIDRVNMSSDGTIILLNETFDKEGSYSYNGHVYALYNGSPRPFQIFSENGQVRGDSDMVESALSADGAYFAGIAIDPDEKDGHSADDPRITFYMYEIPPGVIFEMDKLITLSIKNNLAGEVLEKTTDMEEATGRLHIVKPGRAQYLANEVTHWDTLSDMLDVNLCNPFTSVVDTDEYDWSDKEGTYAVSEPISWKTPECLSTYFTQTNIMVMKVKLYEVKKIADDYCSSLGLLTTATETFLDADGGEYLHVQIKVENQ